MVFHHIHSVPESELHCGLPLTCLTLFARNVKKFQSKSTNSNKVNKLQPKKRPMFPPMSPETEQKKSDLKWVGIEQWPFSSLPPVRTNIIYKLCWNTMHNSLANQGLNVSPIRKQKKQWNQYHATRLDGRYSLWIAWCIVYFAFSTW